MFNVTKVLLMAFCFAVTGLAQAEAKKDINALIKQCNKGINESCVEVAKSYEYGQGVKKSLNQAKKFYEKACNSKDGESCLKLGMLYDKGKLKDSSRTAKLKYFAKACEYNNLDGCIFAGHGSLLDNEDYSKAKEFFLKSCEIEKTSNNKEPEIFRGRGCRDLAKLYEEGKGVEQNYSLAADYYKQSCDLGNKNACGLLGILYRTGKGVPKSDELALPLLTKGSESFEETIYPKVGVHLGEIYKEGKVVEKSYSKAVEFFEKSCNTGLGLGSESCYNLGLMYKDGLGVEKSTDRAIDLFKSACNMHIPSANACVVLGDLYTNGAGVEKSPLQAADFYVKAIKNGNVLAMTKVGLIFLNGDFLGVKAPKRASDYLNAACEKGSGQGCFESGRLYENGTNIDASEFLNKNESNIERSLSKASVYYQKACDLNYGLGCFALGNLYVSNPTEEQSLTKAVVLFKKSCDLDCGEGCYRLSQEYFSAKGVERSIEKSIELAQKACDLNYSIACYNLGLAYKSGKIVLQSYEKSAELMKKSCELGDKHGCSKIATFYKENIIKTESELEKILQQNHYLEKACDLKDSKSCLALGQQLFEVEKSIPNALHWFKKACSMKDAEGCLKVARIYEEGKGIRQSDKVAKEYFGKACDLNNEEGCENYARLNKNH